MQLKQIKEQRMQLYVLNVEDPDKHLANETSVSSKTDIMQLITHPKRNKSSTLYLQNSQKMK